MRTAKYTEKFPLTLTKWQRRELAKAAEERDVSQARLIRIAIGQFLGDQSVQVSH
ncbi:hypothetical protein IWQ55_006636 [Labrenzia sp. EL_208]|nr:hypothetical protein [Labrenzia sp. EL_132]MBG6233394.1 hypothetical protein [Labrenzia sp. EL_208]